MGQSGFSGGLHAGLAVGVQSSPVPRPKFGARTREQELEQRLVELQKQYADLHAAVFEAGQVYRRVCAPRLVRNRSFEIASETFAARHVPGDFIAVRETDDSVLLALGDISGKGLAAGMWIPLLLGLLDLHSEPNAEPAEIMTAMNRDLCRVDIGAPLASLFLGRLDSTTCKLDYCSAGHPPALLQGEDGSLASLSDGGPLLGVVANAPFVNGSVELRDRDTLLAYSDGILEAHNYEDEEFGFDRLQHMLRTARTGYADAVLFSLLGAVQDFVGGCPQADDMSLVVVRRRPVKSV
jgi:serine phosphatase RsbU (regulator of sigma subunit)